MMTECILEDEELGRLLVRVNIRARRLTFRTREDAVYVTVPPEYSVSETESYGYYRLKQRADGSYETKYVGK